MTVTGAVRSRLHRVQPDMARHARACTHDRAGPGFGDAAPRPNNSANAVSGLHAALAAAGIEPQYLLAGNSLGGANAQVLAYLYPEQVKCLMLVEPPTGK